MMRRTRFQLLFANFYNYFYCDVYKKYMYNRSLYSKSIVSFIYHTFIIYIIRKEHQNFKSYLKTTGKDRMSEVFHFIKTILFFSRFWKWISFFFFFFFFFIKLDEFIYLVPFKVILECSYQVIWNAEDKKMVIRFFLWNIHLLNWKKTFTELWKCVAWKVFKRSSEYLYLDQSLRI